MEIYEVELGRIVEGAKDENYDSPQIILIESNHDLEIKEVEIVLKKEIQLLNCDCVHGITQLSKEELKEYRDYYNEIPKYKM